MARQLWLVYGGVAALVVAMTAFVVVAVGGDQPDLAADPGPLISPTADATPSIPAAPTTATSPGPKPRSTPSKTPSKKPTKKPTTKITVAPTVPAPPGCAGKIGTDLSKSAVRGLLEDGAALDEWAALPTPQGLDPLPPIKVPLKLLRAIAFQESGWQSACKARDGIGFGLFQVAKDTQDFVNQRFFETWDRMKPADNVKIAVAYLQYNIVYIGGNYFDQHYDLSDTDLLNYVIASFNVGTFGVLDGDALGEIPNPGYVSAVRTEMLPECVCQGW